MYLTSHDEIEKLHHDWVDKINYNYQKCHKQPYRHGSP